MDSALRQGWTRIIQADDIDDHMQQIGQAAANAELLVALLRTQHCGARQKLLLVGGGTGQFLEYVDAVFFTRFDITVSDINPVFLARARERFARESLHQARFIVDDIESTSLVGPFDVIAVVMVLEHIDWHLGLRNIHGLSPERLDIIIQSNPEDMASAIAPTRKLNPSMQAFAAIAKPTLIASDQLIEFLQSLGYGLQTRNERTVADEKVMLGFSFCRIER